MFRALTTSAHDPGLALDLEPVAGLVGRRPNALAAAEEARLAKLVQAQYDNVWRALRRLGVPEAAADDASQEVFIVAARKLTLIEPERERQYLYGIAVRVAANARRAHAARREQFDEHALLAAPSVVPESDALLEEKQARVRNNTIISKGDSGNGIAFQVTPQFPTPIVANNVVSYMSNPFFAGNAKPTLAGNFFSQKPDSEPWFTDWSNGDFHPAAGSPLIGAADMRFSPSVDIDGSPRQPAPDVGAFQHRP